MRLLKVVPLMVSLPLLLLYLLYGTVLSTAVAHDAAQQSSMSSRAASGEVVTVQLPPSKDNTLYEDPAGGFSNGAGEHFFAGRTSAGRLRRGLLAFNIASSLPAAANILTVTLDLNMSKTNFGSGSEPVSLHRLTAAWGEGVSNAGSNEGQGTLAAPGDATWIHTFFMTSTWTNTGGDFTPSESATTAVDGVGHYQWQTAQMAADVQAWLNHPVSNHGWILLGNESTSLTTKRFDTHENPTPANRPLLTIQYCLSPVTVQNANDSGSGSLRQAIADVCPGGIVDFDASLSGGTVVLSSTLALTKPLSIVSSIPITVSGNNNVRVFRAQTDVTIAGVSIAHGRDSSTECFALSCGAGLKVESGAVVTLNQVSLISNTADVGGAIFNDEGTLSLHNTALLANHASTTGGAVYNKSGITTVSNSQVLTNSAASTAGGILNLGTLVVTSSTFFANRAPNSMGGAILNNAMMTMTNGVLASNSADRGGGIYNFQNGHLTVNNSTLSANTANFGGGIYNEQDMTVNNSTLSNNVADSGGGIFHAGFYNGVATINNSTLAANRATLSGGGINQSSGTITAVNTIIASSPTGGDCASIITSGGFNIDSDGSCGLNNTGDISSTTPLLGPLADNGGDTLTHALLPGSPAIDNGDDVTCAAAPVLNQDQRGRLRPVDGNGDSIAHCDIGAVEFTPQISMEKLPSAQMILSGHDAVFTITVRNTGDISLTNVFVVDQLTPDCDNALGSMQVDAQIIYTCTALNVTANFTNTAVVTGTFAGASAISAVDSAFVALRLEVLFLPAIVKP